MQLTIPAPDLPSDIATNQTRADKFTKQHSVGLVGCWQAIRLPLHQKIGASFSWR